jgi:signal transduction histidine kinase
MLELPLVLILRYETDQTVSVLADWSEQPHRFQTGTRWPLDGPSVAALVAAPIVVDGTLWGSIATGQIGRGTLPAQIEDRLAEFTDLVAAAISNSTNREELARLAAQHTSLRRVATLVAQAVPPAELFSAVSEEAAALFGAGAAVLRLEHDPPGIVVVGVAKLEMPLGSRFEFEDGMASAEVYRTGRSSVVDRRWRDRSSAGGPAAAVVRRLGTVAGVGSPIVVEGRLWGVMALSSDEVLPFGTERRLEKFTELVATAIANSESREALMELAEQQAALRRVATLVVEGATEAELFACVAQEVAQVFGVRMVSIDRYDSDGTSSTVVASIDDPGFPVGSRWPLDGPSVGATVLATARPARIDDYGDLQSTSAAAMREFSASSAVGVPIFVDGRVWGVICVAATGGARLPEGIEERIADFTELVAMAIVSADTKSELAASRRRIVAATDEARRRIERDLHDGTQQRLVTLLLRLKAVKNGAPTGQELVAELDRLQDEVESALDELRETSRGIHPAIVSEGGLKPALRTLARRSMVPVKLDVGSDARLPEPIEVAAYFIVSEALTNATKHARASRVEVSLALRNGSLLLSIRDDGIGGADPGQGSGLLGLSDRIEALGGTLQVTSPTGNGTTLLVRIPLEGPGSIVSAEP